MSHKFDLTENVGETVKPDHFEHPDLGWLAYDPQTLYISPSREGQRPIVKPIKMIGKFFGTKQPIVPTCSEPGPGNMGCSKWPACPMKKWPHVGPGMVIMSKTGTRSFSNCYDYFEATSRGRPVSQVHYGMQGWKLDTGHTSIPVMGRTEAVQLGKLGPESSREAVMASRPKAWEMEVGDLLPPWWPLLKKKGFVLPQSSEHYPELVEEQAPRRPRGRPKKS